MKRQSKAEHEKRVKSDEIEDKINAKVTKKWKRHPTSTMEEAREGTFSGSMAEELQRRGHGDQCFWLWGGFDGGHFGILIWIVVEFRGPKRGL